MYYSSPDQVVFLTTREEYAPHYVDPRKYIVFDEFYGEFGKPIEKRRMPLVHANYKPAVDVYKLWAELNPEEKVRLFEKAEEQRLQREKEDS